MQHSLALQGSLNLVDIVVKHAHIGVRFRTSANLMSHLNGLGAGIVGKKAAMAGIKIRPEQNKPHLLITHSGDERLQMPCGRG